MTDTTSDYMNRTTISAFFDSRDDAETAIERLRAAGLAESHIRLVEGSADDSVEPIDREKGFWDKLSDFFLPEEDRYTYASGLTRGGYLIAVTSLSPAEYEIALGILDDEGTVDLAEREEHWRAEGWGGYEASSYAATGASASATGLGAAPALNPTDPLETGQARGTDDEVIPVVEETLRVGKRATAQGSVRVRAYTVEEPISETIALRSDHVEVERRPVDRDLSATDDAFKDRTIEVEEYREEAVVAKDARVVEEIALRKANDVREETVTDTVRHTEVEVEDSRDTSRTDRPELIRE